MESHSKSKLGKGLGALIADKKDYIIEMDIGNIVQNPVQPRKTFEDEKIKELADSIIEKGILQPIIVREKNGKYEIIAGERRFRAATEAKLKKVPVIIKNVDDEESLELAIIENVQREDLNPIEEGEAYRVLIEKYDYTQEELAKKLGKNRTTITNKLRALKLPETIKNYIAEGKISSGHAVAILSIDDNKEQLKFAQKIANDSISVRAAESMAKDIKKGTGKKSNRVESKTVEIVEIENKMRDFLGTRVKIKEIKGKGGKIEIELYSEGDLERILETIGIN